MGMPQEIAQVLSDAAVKIAGMGGGEKPRESEDEAKERRKRDWMGPIPDNPNSPRSLLG